MKVLIACEYSGTVRDAFIKAGHDALSCDLEPTEKPGPHYQGSILDIIDKGWDMMIAHPPCTYLSRAGARWLHKAGSIDPDRYQKGLEAKAFWEAMFNANIKRIAVENPTPLKLFGLPTPHQVVQPFEFGHPYSKRTLLWLKNLPPLMPTNIITNHTPFLPSNTGGKKRGQAFSRGVAKNAVESSRTFQGIADAMANQWGNL